MTASAEPSQKNSELENEIADLEQRLIQARAKRPQQPPSTSSPYPQSPSEQLANSQQPP